MKSKDANDSSNALRKVFNRLIRAPICTVSFDFGTEFTNKKSMEVLREFSAYHFFLREPKKASLAELFVKFVQTSIRKFMAAKNTKRYLEILPQIEQARNERALKSLGGMRPVDVTFENSEKFFDILYPNFYKTKSRKKVLPIGQKVLLATTRGNFSKTYETVNFDPDKIYEIIKVHKSPVDQVVRYSLKDTADDLNLNGTFYKEEIQPIKPYLKTEK